MILIDASVLVEWFRGVDQYSRFLSQTEDTDQILICDVVLLEVLKGARDDLHAARLQRDLSHFGKVGVLDTHIAVRAAENYRRLRSLGITIRKSNGLIIGTWCIENDCPLLHNDRDFRPMVEHLGLQEF